LNNYLNEYYVICLPEECLILDDIDELMNFGDILNFRGQYREAVPFYNEAIVSFKGNWAMKMNEIISHRALSKILKKN